MLMVGRPARALGSCVGGSRRFWIAREILPEAQQPPAHPAVGCPRCALQCTGRGVLCVKARSRRSTKKPMLLRVVLLCVSAAGLAPLWKVLLCPHPGLYEHVAPGDGKVWEALASTYRTRAPRAFGSAGKMSTRLSHTDKVCSVAPRPSCVQLEPSRPLPNGPTCLARSAAVSRIESALARSPPFSNAAST